MMRPHLFASIEGSASRVVWKADDKLMREDGVPLFGREILQRRHMLDAGVVDEDVEPAGRLQCLLDHLADRLRLRHVSGRVGHPNIEVRGDFRLHVCDLLRLAEAVEDDLRAGGSQGSGNAKPMPLVDPVTSDTLPSSACRLLIFCGLMAMFMAKAPGWDGFPRSLRQSAEAGMKANACWLMV